MRLIVQEIDCGPRRCEKCDYANESGDADWSETYPGHCDLFGEKLEWDIDERKFELVRCSECLRADVTCVAKDAEKAIERAEAAEKELGEALVALGRLRCILGAHEGRGFESIIDAAKAAMRKE